MARKRTVSRPKGAPDVLIIGGGIMGSACAFRLATAGARVTVLERSVPGAEASSAAAGIVGAAAEAEGEGPMTDLMRASQRLHAEWARRLFATTQIDVGFRKSGILRVTFEQGEARELRTGARGRGREARVVGSAELMRLEPKLAPLSGGVLYAGDGRIDPPAFFRALHIAAQRAGVIFQTGAYVKRLQVESGAVRGVLLEDGTVCRAPIVVVAAGSWTPLVDGLPSAATRVVPVRGQIVELSTPAPLLHRVVFGPRCYIVPRDDGRALVGSTLEFVGYRKEVTASAVRDLLGAAIELVPDLAMAELRSTWSNFRPYTEDALPLLGESSIRGLFFATGHYRNGILLAPATAECIAAAIEGRKPPVSLAAFSPERA